MDPDRHRLDGVRLRDRALRILPAQLVSLDHAPEAAEESTSTAWVGAALVALGVLAHLVATVRYARSRRAISRGDFGGSRAGTVIAFGAIATLVGAGMTVLLVLALND